MFPSPNSWILIIFISFRSLEPTFWFTCFDIFLLFNCRPSIKLPVRLVSFVFSLLKWTHEKESLGSNYDTVYQYALLASSTRTFNCNAAKKHLGYTPVVTLEVSLNWILFCFYLIQLLDSFLGFISSCWICRMVLHQRFSGSLEILRSLMTRSFNLLQISFLVVEKVRTISLLTIIMPF